MGSCCESDNRKTKGIDDTAGGLVWVRRRNGSWWPGRILGLDELPESYSVSPRAGTPVKLLGREDGSMDWYNLEKSKRIKAFRCGEYDECIEKARAYAVQSNRIGGKERKYARREDAILHALELEQARYTQSEKELGSGVNRRNGTVNYVGLSKEQSHLIRKLNKLEGKTKTKLSQSKAPLEQRVNLDTVDVHDVQEERWKAPSDSEDDGTAGVKRMRGLQELGLRVVSKRKLNMICTEVPCEPSLQDNSSLGESNINNGFSSNSAINSSKEPCTSQRKRTHMAQVHESLRRKNRRRQLTKVLESSTTVDAPSICSEGGNSNHSSLHGVVSNRIAVSEPAESKKTDYSEVVNGSLGSSETSRVEASEDAYKNSSNPLFDGDKFCSLEFVNDGFLDIPGIWKEIQTGEPCGGFQPCASRKLQSGAKEKQCNGYFEVDPIKQDNEIDVKSSSSFEAHANNTRQRIDKGSLKEDVKGEKNSKNGHRSAGSIELLGRFEQSESYLLDKPDLDVEDGVTSISFHKSLACDNVGQARCGLVSEDVMQDLPMAGAPQVNRLPKRNCEWQVSTSAEIVVQSDEMGDVPCSPPTHERQMESLTTRDLSLFQLPPRRSLPRRQTHPIACSCCQVEDLSTRSSTVGSALYDVKLEVHATYQGPRVPLISLMSRLNGTAIVGHPVTVEVVEDGYCNVLLRHSHAASRSFDMHRGQKENYRHKRDVVDNSLFREGGGMIVKLQRRAGCVAKLHPDARRSRFDQPMVHSSLLGKKSSRIRKSGFLARKIRKLSSITVDCEHEEERRKPVVENTRRTIACVPLKLVFSRINEALSCPSRPGNHVSASDDR